MTVHRLRRTGLRIRCVERGTIGTWAGTRAVLLEVHRPSRADSR